jgi:hypothetical protein
MRVTVPTPPMAVALVSLMAELTVIVFWAAASPAMPTAANTNLDIVIFVSFSQSLRLQSRFPFVPDAAATG